MVKRIGIGVLAGILALALLVPALAFAADSTKGSNRVAGTCRAAAECIWGYAANVLDAYSGISLNDASDTNDAFQNDRYEGGSTYYGGSLCGGHAFLDTDGDGICDNYGSCRGLEYRDTNGDGVCDNYGNCQGLGYLDVDGDGICDNYGNGRGLGYLDADGNGVCDNFGTGQGAGNFGQGYRHDEGNAGDTGSRGICGNRGMHHGGQGYGAGGGLGRR